MNKLLAEARKQFRGQKGKIQTGFDNTPVPEGKYTCVIDTCEVKEREMKEVLRPVLYVQLSIETGELKNRKLWPYPNPLDDLEGVSGAAKLIRTVKGDVLPGRKVGDEFELDFDAFIGSVEELAASCVSELVEVQVKNSKKKRDDGTPYQSVFVNRGLEDDAKGVLNRKPTTDTHDKREKGSLAVGTPPTRAKPKVTARK